jgi:hypothetical protein
LLQLEDFAPNQLHLLHLAVYYARKQVSMISRIIRSRLVEHERRQRAQRQVTSRSYARVCAPPLHQPATPVRSDGILTFMFMLVRPASLGLELGAHLLEELCETSARHWPRRAHAAMRVVHVRCGLVAMVRVVLQVGGISGVVGGLRSRLRCDGLQPCRGCRTANALAAGGYVVDEEDRRQIRRGRSDFDVA